MIKDLFEQELQVINVGLSSFADSIQLTGGKAIQLDWRPHAAGDRETGMKLAMLINNPEIEAANRTAHDRFLSAQPILTGVQSARHAIPNLGERTLLHAGPPIEWHRMCGPMQGALIGAILYESWAQDQESARQLAGSGEITFAPCHHFGAVGPMAGVISPSMPVWIVRNQDRDNTSFSNLNEGLGKVLRFGANDASVLERLKWMGSVLGPLMNAALQQLGGVELRPIIAQALHMGDECHNRNAAASSLLFKKLTPALLKTDCAPGDIARVLEFIAGNDHFFLNISMACCKAMLDAAHGVEHSTLVTAMARMAWNLAFESAAQARHGSRPPRQWWMDFSSRAILKPTLRRTWATVRSQRLQASAVLPWALHLQSCNLWVERLRMRSPTRARCITSRWE